MLTATCIEHNPTAGFSDGETTLSTAGTPALTTLNRLMAQSLRKLLSFLTRTFGIAGVVLVPLNIAVSAAGGGLPWSVQLAVVVVCGAVIPVRDRRARATRIKLERERRVSELEAAQRAEQALLQRVGEAQQRVLDDWLRSPGY